MSEISNSIESEITFQDLDLGPELLGALETLGYTSPTPIQAETIPLLLEGRDVIGQAQTGTGKTAAFALPMLKGIDPANRKTQVLVLTPTRELAVQVAEAFERYSSNMRDIRVAAIYGGQDYPTQIRQLNRGVQVVIGTPGRVMDHMRKGTLVLDGLTGLVLDEADEMLRMGFAEDVQWILTQTNETRQIALFSATMPNPIREIAKTHLRNPAHITIRQKTATADTIRQRFVVAAPHQKEQALARILEAEPVDGVIVFVKTRSTTEPLAEFLTISGHRAAALNGDVPQKQRERIVEHLKAGKLDVIVATDVAARGLDVQRVSHVINYDLPFDSEAYVHRIGRTGRAGRSGEAILFVNPRERGRLRRLEQATRQPIEPMELPTNRQINKQRIARFHAKITATLAEPAVETFTSVLEQYRRDNPEVTAEQLAGALALMTHGNTPLLMKDEFRPATFEAPRGREDRDFNRGDRRDDRRDDRRPRSGDRDMSDRPARRPRRDDEPMERFRLEVGHRHQVKPGNIVGAIANEAGLDSAMIGRIEIFDDYSTVDLPEGMPRNLFETLKQVWVAGRQLQISRMSGNSYEPSSDEASASGKRPPAGPKKFEGKDKGFKAKKRRTKEAAGTP